ncbi:hypothetical protein [Methanobrevibacter sp.]|uniref:hypothetical protein n=1 Tax=Methanobrevibacter sp. TaxID=66852 RepID=UPI0026E10853|nr:hypothetical protein [Methanobrevibacter sp.]MDO5824613.1 hypothetical protein [Methanobrevibacter sp.]
MFERLGEMQLIKEREEYEIEFFNNFDEEIFKKDTLDILIESYDENHDFDCENDFNFYEELEFDFMNFEEYDHNSMEFAYEGNSTLGYILNNDSFNKIKDYDYPEGVDENLNGIKYLEFDEIDDYSCNQVYEPEFISDEGNNHFESANEFKDENHMENLIEEYLDEETAFLESLIDEYLSEKAAFLESLIEY